MSVCGDDDIDEDNDEDDAVDFKTEFDDCALAKVPDVAFILLKVLSKGNAFRELSQILSIVCEDGLMKSDCMSCIFVSPWRFLLQFAFSCLSSKVSFVFLE